MMTRMRKVNEHFFIVVKDHTNLLEIFHNAIKKIQQRFIEPFSQPFKAPANNNKNFYNRLFFFTLLVDLLHACMLLALLTTRPAPNKQTQKKFFIASSSACARCIKKQT